MIPDNLTRYVPAVPLIIGIDEAGYGPLLGPLMAAASVWRVERRHFKRDLWQLLSDSVCKPEDGGDYRITVGDSKEAFDRKRGICTLERTVLAFAATLGWPCTSLATLLQHLGTDGFQAAGIPWYRDLSIALPFDPIGSKFELVAERLQENMTAAGVRCIALMAEVVAEDRFNARLAQTNSKATVLVEHILRLIQRGADLAPGEDILIHVDRLGGRMDYRALLMSAFGERELRVVAEEPECSRYRLIGPRDTWYFDFTVESDKHNLPVALASMVAKYVREALMHGFNAFWKQHLPDIKPTAGYYKDAQRFLADIDPVIAATGLQRDIFIRAR